MVTSSSTYNEVIEEEGDVELSSRKKSKATRKYTRSKSTAFETQSNTMLLIPNLVEFLRLCWEDVSEAKLKRRRGRT